MSDDWTEEPEPPEEEPEERLLKVIQGETIPCVLRREYIGELVERIHCYVEQPQNYDPKAHYYLLWEAEEYLTRLVDKLKPRN